MGIHINNASLTSNYSCKHQSGFAFEEMDSCETQHDETDTKLFVSAILRIVALAAELNPEVLVKPQRGSATVSRARQISYYLLHTSLSLSLAQIARIYQKDRTTIGHACRLIEDLRDNEAFDTRITHMEKLIRTMMKIHTIGQ